MVKSNDVHWLLGYWQHQPVGRKDQQVQVLLNRWVCNHHVADYVCIIDNVSPPYASCTSVASFHVLSFGMPRTCALGAAWSAAFYHHGVEVLPA